MSSSWNINLLADLKARSIEYDPTTDVNFSIELAKGYMKVAESHFWFIGLEYKCSATYNASELEIKIVDIKLLRIREILRCA